MKQNGFSRIRKQAKWAIPVALEHAGADGRCGREWVCACGGCNVIRAEIKHRNSIRIGRYDGNKFITDIEDAIRIAVHPFSSILQSEEDKRRRELNKEFVQ